MCEVACYPGAVLALLLLFTVTQVPCAPIDSTVVCHCKQGIASACSALSATDPQKAKIIQDALRMAKLAEEGAREVEATSSEEAEAQGTNAEPEPPDRHGQGHHVISRLIAKELARHKTLRGLYKPRDPRFVAKAKDWQSHCGYQQWHRDVDREVIAWLRRETDATPKEFMAFLRELYGRPAMRARFPNGF